VAAWLSLLGADDAADQGQEAIMNGRNILKTTAGGLALAAGAAAAGYAALVVLNRARYGEPRAGDATPGDSLLDQFIPQPEVVEHHEIEIDAPAEIVLATAKAFELLNSPVVRAIIRARELVMGGEPDTRPHPDKLLEQMQSIGWVVLAEQAGRELVMGAVTQPWLAAPVFRSISPDKFLSFDEPGFVKIVWTLRADPIDDGRSTFTTETRVCTTDAEARARFRTYWSFVAPGVQLIRVAMLSPLKRAAEREYRGHAPTTAVAISGATT
jgi:hypothetical protein